MIMVKALREFQIFVKPNGAVCNLACQYCYYLDKGQLYPAGESFRMPDDILEDYIVQHMNAYPEPVIRFSWHGGEPTLAGLDYFRKIVDLQRRHQPTGSRILNGIMTNGTLLDEDWCRFLATEGFVAGISLDGPEKIHDRYRITRNQTPTHERVMRGYSLLQKYHIPCDVLCVVNAHNVQYPVEVYRFFKQIRAPYITFLPLVQPQPEQQGGVSDLTVPAEAFGHFLCTVFDEWQRRDIGQINVQIFEEAIRIAFGQEHSLCIFRPVCGDIPVVEHNGDFFSCDHFVDPAHRLGNIRTTPLVELLESPVQRAFGRAKQDALPGDCLACDVLSMCNGECPKNRFIRTADGQPGLNYLCAGYKMFFNHCRPFVQAVADQWRRGKDQSPVPPVEQTAPAGKIAGPGRNDPCPCGSGKKYKKCCLDK